MVMHARKQQRLHDGYAERKDAHLHQSMQYQQKGYGGLFGDGSPAEHGHNARGDSPSGRPSPQYQNKPDYIERNKEKRGSLSLAEKKVNQYLATGSIGQNAPGTHTSREHHREHDHHQDGNHDNGSHGPEKGSSNKKDHKYEKERDHRAEVQKSAVRVYGDWSEHISSSGKRYYYNCKTEVSQWEKPKEWHDGARPDKSKESRGSSRPASSSTQSRSGDERRHSMQGDSRYRPAHTETSEKHTQKLSERQKSHSVDTGNTSCASTTPSGANSYRSSSTVQRSNSATDTHSQNHSGHGSHMGHPELKRNNVFGYSAGEPAWRRIRHDSENSRSLGGPHQEGVPTEDMDISPGSTPTSSRPSSCTGTPKLPAASTPAYSQSTNCQPLTSPSTSSSAHNLTSSVTSLLPNLNSTPSTADANRKAIETLQELQKALSMHIKAQQRIGGGGQCSSSSGGTTSAHLQSQLNSLHDNLTSQLQQQHNSAPQHRSPHHPSHSQGVSSSVVHLPDEVITRDRDGRESPLSDMSPRSSCRSPTPSTGSSQTAHTIGTSALSAAALKSQQSVNLTPSLSNYYHEKLIGHVLGWQADQIERQADRLRQEGLALGSLHCSRVSVELKRARSLVRAAEIQSTIHEQRILVLQQQRAEIENLKPPTSFLPS